MDLYQGEEEDGSGGRYWLRKEEAAAVVLHTVGPTAGAMLAATGHPATGAGVAAASTVASMGYALSGGRYDEHGEVSEERYDQYKEVDGRCRNREVLEAFHRNGWLDELSEEARENHRDTIEELLEPGSDSSSDANLK